MIFYLFMSTYIGYVLIVMALVLILGLAYKGLAYIYYEWHPKPKPKASSGRMVCHVCKARVNFTFHQVCWDCYRERKK